MSSRTTPPRTKMVGSSFPLFDRLGAPRGRLERSFFTWETPSACRGCLPLIPLGAMQVTRLDYLKWLRQRSVQQRAQPSTAW